MNYTETSSLLIEHELDTLEKNSRFLETKKYWQHGGISVYEHCINVAKISCKIADIYHLDVNYPAMIRGALLHDYFLYNQHDKQPSHRLHGWKHPRIASQNAKRDCNVTPLEEDIILRHMFPLTPFSPAFLEGWIVSLADKICACMELYQNYKRRLSHAASAK